MKTFSSLLAAMALLALAAIGASGVHVDDNPISHHAHVPANDLVTSEPVADERTWVPFRALRSMDSPKQGPHPHDDGKHAHAPHDPHHDSKKDAKQAPRALGQAHVTPAPTVPNTRATPAPTKTGGSNLKATPAPTKTNTPRATPASTTTRATPRPTITSSTAHHVASPPANNKKPRAPADHDHPTKQGKTGASSTANATQQKTRNLGGSEAKQQLFSDHHHSAKQGMKKGGKHQ